VTCVGRLYTFARANWLLESVVFTSLVVDMSPTLRVFTLWLCFHVVVLTSVLLRLVLSCVEHTHSTSWRWNLNLGRYFSHGRTCRLSYVARVEPALG